MRRLQAAGLGGGKQIQTGQGGNDGSLGGVGKPGGKDGKKAAPMGNKKAALNNTTIIPKPQTNWARDSRLHDAVKEWDNLPAENQKSISKFAKQKGIPPFTFHKYVCNNRSKRRTLGKHAGKKSIVSKENAEFVA